MGKYEDADQCYTEAIILCREISQGATSVDIADTLLNQCVNYCKMKQYRKAALCNAEALSIFKKDF